MKQKQRQTVYVLFTFHLYHRFHAFSCVWLNYTSLQMILNIWYKKYKKCTKEVNETDQIMKLRSDEKFNRKWESLSHQPEKQSTIFAQKKRVNKFHELAVSKTPQTIFFISAFLYTNKFIKKEFKKQRTAYVFLSLDMESV